MNKLSLNTNEVNKKSLINLGVLNNILPMVRKAIISTVIVGALIGGFTQNSYADSVPQGNNIAQEQVVKDKAYFSKFALLSDNNIDQVANQTNKQIIIEDKVNDRIQKLSLNRSLEYQMKVAENISTQRIAENINNLISNNTILREYNGNNGILSSFQVNNGNEKWELDQQNGLGYTHIVNGNIVGQVTGTEALNQLNNFISKNTNEISKNMQSLEINNEMLIASSDNNKLLSKNINKNNEFANAPVTGKKLKTTLASLGVKNNNDLEM